MQSLKQQLRDEASHHQRELASAQDVHAQKLVQLKRKHRDDIRKYEDQITELQDLFDIGECKLGMERIVTPIRFTFFARVSMKRKSCRNASNVVLPSLDEHSVGVLSRQWALYVKYYLNLNIKKN